MSDKWSDQDVDAALCIWEYALQDSPSTDKFLDWLKQGEGMAQAREYTAELGKWCEVSYIYAKHWGYESCFDWEFVPAWCDHALKTAGGPYNVNAVWSLAAGILVYEEGKEDESRLERDMLQRQKLDGLDQGRERQGTYPPGHEHSSVGRNDRDVPNCS